MNKRSPFLNFIIVLISFVAIEGICFLLISNNGNIQRYKLMEGVRRVQSFFWEEGSDIKYFFSLRKVNHSLVEENRRLANENEVYKSMISSQVRDSTIHIDSIPAFSFIQAKVIHNTTNREHNYIIIDKGSEDGIKPDMGVITPQGIVGYVHSAGKRFSMVVSFLDINHSISAVIKKNNTFGPLRWNGKNIKRALLSEIPLHTDFFTGDTITTSGFSAIYPPEIKLGTIHSSNLIDGINYELTIDLFEDYSSLYWVYVVVNNNIEEISKLNKEGEGLL